MSLHMLRQMLDGLNQLNQPAIPAIAVRRRIHELRMAEAGAGDFTAGIRSAVRGLWTGAGVRFWFVDNMTLLIEKHLTKAYNAGAKAAGIAENELTPEERDARDAFVFGQFTYIHDFADAILERQRLHQLKPRDPGGQLGPLFNRVPKWANRWNAAYNLGLTNASNNPKLEWVLHLRRGTKKTCGDCSRLNGRVYRANTWRKWDVRPQPPSLLCHGYNCGCGFRPTDAPVTPGRPPGLRG